jgi:hypothetical protein
MAEQRGMPCTTPAQASAPGTSDSWWLDVFDGVVLAILVATIVTAERLDVARATVAMVADAGRPDQAANTSVLAILWLVVVIVGIVAALRVRWRTISEVEAINARRTGGRALSDQQRRLLKQLTGISIAIWIGWQLWGIAGIAWDVPQPGRSAVHYLALAFALVAIGGAGRQVVGDPGSAWEHASAVRLQLILLGLLFALVFVVPLTAAQLVDVLRGWGDQPGTRAMLGVASALVLGAVCRASAIRLLAPADAAVAGPTRRRVARAMAAALALLAVVLVCAQAFVGAAACVLALGVAVSTRWVPGIQRPAADDPLTSHRLAGTLGVFALATVFVGLVNATVDSWLLPDPGTGADVALLSITIGVGILFGVLAGDTHRRPRIERGPAGKRLRDGFYAVMAFVLTLLAAFGPPVISRGKLDFLYALLLLVFAILLALRQLGERGNPELWIGAGVVAGAAFAVYVKPIEVARVFGAFAVTLIACTGLLLVLHGAASWGMRREPKLLRNILPRTVPVVTLLAVWIGGALVYSQQSHSTAHQARTIESTQPPGHLGDSVDAWLDREAGTSPPKYLPMLLVGASGGGAKASYWTDLVMDCLLGRGAPVEGGECAPAPPGAGARRFRRLFLTSSVSGGSIGIFHLLRSMPRAAAGGNWVDPSAGAEVLSPVTAWGFFHDLPAFLLGADTDPRECRDDEAECRIAADRALVQEASVAGQDGLVPRGEMTARLPASPVAVFNGALDGGDGRVLASRLALSPPRAADPSCDTAPSGEPGAGSVDARDVLWGDQDVPLVTAALMSARFPGIAPAARLGDADLAGSTPGCKVTPPPLPPVQVRDGGYVENTGLMTITELLPAITARTRAWAKRRSTPGHPVHVQLIVLSIDDDPAVVDPAPKLEERREALGIGKRAGTGYLSRLARNRLTSCQYPDVTYRRISPPPHVGAHAATGWEISQTSRERDLRSALRRESKLDGEPRQVIEWLRGVLDGTADPLPLDCAS